MAQPETEITQYLEEDGHRIWGYVIYRCSYGSQSDWDMVINLLRDQLREGLTLINDLKRLEDCKFTIIDNKTELDGAPTAFVREKFKQWCIDAPQREQGQGKSPGRSLRYHYCIYLDDECIDSIKHNSMLTGRAERDNRGFVKLIDKGWEDYTDDLDVAAGEVENYPPIEGCVLEDIGWMRVDWRQVLTHMAMYLRDTSSWGREYRRPPWVVNCC